MNIFDYLNINGHVTIHKLLGDGTEELIYDDHNVIVSGMGVGLASFFGVSGSTSILDYQIDRFQIGVSGSEAREVSSTNSLSGPLSSSFEYTGEDGELFPLSANQIKGTFDGNISWYAAIPAHNVTKIGDSSVRYTITIDKDSCNNLRTATTYLNEVGLFMKNPLNTSPIPSPILVAYKYFSPIRKTSDFALVLRWTLNF